MGGVTHVVPGHQRTEATRGRDGLQPGDAGAEDQNLRGSGGAGRGHQHREVRAVGVGGDQHRLVARDVRLRGQRVHRLCPAQGARQHVQADRCHLRRREPLRQPRVRQRLEQSDEGLTGVHARDVVGRAYAEQHVSLGVDLVAVDHPGAGSDVGGVGVPGGLPGPGLDHDGHARRHEPGDPVGSERHPTLIPGSFADDTERDRRHRWFPTNMLLRAPRRGVGVSTSRICCWDPRSVTTEALMTSSVSLRAGPEPVSLTGSPYLDAVGTGEPPGRAGRKSPARAATASAAARHRAPPRVSAGRTETEAETELTSSECDRRNRGSVVRSARTLSDSAVEIGTHVSVPAV